MAETAAEQFERVLQLIALAGRSGGMSYDDLVAALGVTRRQLDRDLDTLTDRDFYLPAGTANDIQVILDDERVEIWTTGSFRRPTRLTPREAAALDLGLRILAAERDDPALAQATRELLTRVARSVPDDVGDRLAPDGDPGTADAIRAMIIDAARRRHRLRITYLKPDAEEPGDRSVEPYAVVHAEGLWYVIGRDPDADGDGIRTFRTDRIIDVVVSDARYEVPADFDPDDYVKDGRAYSGGEEIEVVVRYGGRVAPWLLERGEGERQEDGSVVVRHQVSAPGWIVRHVLGYGPDARVLEPEWVAELVASGARRLEGNGEKP